MYFFLISFIIFFNFCFRERGSRLSLNLGDFRSSEPPLPPPPAAVLRWISDEKRAPSDRSALTLSESKTLFFHILTKTHETKFLDLGKNFFFFVFLLSFSGAVGSPLLGDCLVEGPSVFWSPFWGYFEFGVLRERLKEL